MLSQNIFQDEYGSVHSWKLKLDKENPGNNPSSYVQGLVNDLEDRYFGKERILGGQRLEAAARYVMGLGDCFMELGVESDGNGWAIAKSIYLPTMSMFVDEDMHGQLYQYRQQAQLNPSNDDIVWSGAGLGKILHFKSPNSGRYGHIGTLPQIDTWGDIKDAAADLADAARGSSILPTVHTMPEGKGDNYRNEYREEYEAREREGIIMNLFVSHTAKVEKLAAATPTLKPLIDNYLRLRYQMIIPGVPVYLIPGLGLEQGSSKQLGGAPALQYGKLINSFRSYLAEQICWAIGVEVVMNKGVDYWLEQRPKVEIEWPEFITQEVPGLTPTKKDEEAAQEKLATINANFAKSMTN